MPSLFCPFFFCTFIKILRQPPFACNFICRCFFLTSSFQFSPCACIINLSVQLLFSLDPLYAYTSTAHLHLHTTIVTTHTRASVCAPSIRYPQFAIPARPGYPYPMRPAPKRARQRKTTAKLNRQAGMITTQTQTTDEQTRSGTRLLDSRLH